MIKALIRPRMESDLLAIIRCLQARAGVHTASVDSDVQPARTNTQPRTVQAEIEAIRPTLVNERGMRCVGDRCSALSGELGVKTSCEAYDVRPQVCRNCEAGDPECNLARAKFGFPALVAG